MTEAENARALAMSRVELAPRVGEDLNPIVDLLKVGAPGRAHQKKDRASLSFSYS